MTHADAPEPVLMPLGSGGGGAGGDGDGNGDGGGGGGAPVVGARAIAEVLHALNDDARGGNGCACFWGGVAAPVCAWGERGVLVAGPRPSLHRTGNSTSHSNTWTLLSLSPLSVSISPNSAHADERVLEITAPFVALSSPSPPADATAIAADDGDGGDGAAPAPLPRPPRVSVVDTPGPNEAGEDGLRFQVERLLCGVDAALYLLDYTKLKTAEEAATLARLRSLNPELARRLCTRLFFVVNKVDQAAAAGAGALGPEETKEYVAREVTRQLALPGFSLHPDQVLLVSARDALLARLALAGRSGAGGDAAERLAAAAFGPVGARALARQPPAARREACRLAAVDMLEASGVPELEARVLSFLEANAGGLKLVAALDDAGRLLSEVHNAAAACAASLASDAAALAASRDALAAEFGDAVGEFDGVARAAEALEVEVVDEVREVHTYPGCCAVLCHLSSHSPSFY